MNVSLRQLKHSDAPYLVRNLNLVSVTQYLSANIPHPYTEQDANWWLSTGSKTDAINYAIELNQEFVGVVGIYLQYQDAAQSAEIGYWLAPESWSQGIMTQAVRLFCEKIFNDTEIIKLFNPVSEPNIASSRVMEKAGFHCEKILPNSVKHQGEEVNERHFVLLKP